MDTGETPHGGNLFTGPKPESLKKVSVVYHGQADATKLFPGVHDDNPMPGSGYFASPKKDSFVSVKQTQGTNSSHNGILLPQRYIDKKRREALPSDPNQENGRQPIQQPTQNLTATAESLNDPLMKHQEALVERAERWNRATLLVGIQFGKNLLVKPGETKTNTIITEPQESDTQTYAVVPQEMFGRNYGKPDDEVVLVIGTGGETTKDRLKEYMRTIREHLKHAQDKGEINIETTIKSIIDLEEDIGDKLFALVFGVSPGAKADPDTPLAHAVLDALSSGAVNDDFPIIDPENIPSLLSTKAYEALFGSDETAHIKKDLAEKFVSFRTFQELPNISSEQLRWSQLSLQEQKFLAQDNGFFRQGGDNPDDPGARSSLDLSHIDISNQRFDYPVDFGKTRFDFASAENLIIESPQYLYLSDNQEERRPYSDLRSSSWMSANMQSAYIKRAAMDNASFYNTNCQNSTFDSVLFPGAEFHGNFSNTIFYQCDFQARQKIDGSSGVAAEFRDGINLAGAVFVECNLTDQQKEFLAAHNARILSLTEFDDSKYQDLKDRVK